MKQEILNLTSFEGVSELSSFQLSEIEGGGFWGDVAYLVTATAKCIVVFCQTAAEFQASLPPNLKK